MNNEEKTRDEIIEEVSEEAKDEALEENEAAEKEDESGESDNAGAEESGKEEKGQEVQDEAMEIKYMRLMADFQNFRRRTEKEKSDIYQFANEGIVKELLDVVDNFERAFSTETEDKKYEEGMKMIFNQLMACLERAGVVEIDCLGKEFDPNYHNAVMTEDSTEYDSGTVTKVLQKGYLLHDRVVRPAMVMTAN